MKIAIVGSGISGLAAAHRLQGEAHVTLFEAVWTRVFWCSTNAPTRS